MGDTSPVAEEHVALVTGASRGVGRGVAIALGKARWTVYLTGRTREEGATDLPLPGSLQSTAQAIDQAGGRAVPIQCDHRNDGEVHDAVERIAREQAHLDLLVNGVWGGYERFVADTPPNFGPFWEQPLELWDSMHAAGLRSAYVASTLSAPLMLDSPGGLIVCLSSFAARNYVTSVAYGVAHAGVDRMVADMAVELESTPVTVVALYPGIVRTENVLRNAEYVDLSNSESPEFVGRAVLALFDDKERTMKSGQALVVAELAGEYGFTDVDGTTPRSLRGTLAGPDRGA
jgi:dehydrogenase/reductase SDR family protein 1